MLGRAWTELPVGVGWSTVRDEEQSSTGHTDIHDADARVCLVLA